MFAADDGSNLGGGSSQAGDPSQSTPPQAGNTTPSDPQAGAGTTPPQKSTEDYERIIADLRKENAGHRTARKTLEEEKRLRDEAQLSEQQKLEKNYADLQRSHEEYKTEVQSKLIRSEIRTAAADLGFTDPADAISLINRSELEYDDDGVPSNAKALLEKLAKAKPYLLKSTGQSNKPTSTAGGATSPSRSSTSGPQDITKDYVNSIMAGGPEKWNALTKEEQDRISAFVRKGGTFKR